MRILILGERPTDLGSVKHDGTIDREGVLPILVRKLVEANAEETQLELGAMPIKEIRAFKRHKHQTGPSPYGYAAKLRIVLGLQVGRYANAVVAVVDRDGKKNTNKIDDLSIGRESVQQSGKHCAVGLAIEMIEAWLLADEQALRKALNSKHIQRQPDPESLWAKDEKNDKHPKGRLRRMVEQARDSERGDDPIWEYYARIAEDLDIDLLVKRCPKGFSPFSEQVKEFVSD